MCPLHINYGRRAPAAKCLLDEMFVLWLEYKEEIAKLEFNLLLKLVCMPRGFDRLLFLFRLTNLNQALFLYLVMTQL
jgi:hypothetical protein